MINLGRLVSRVCYGRVARVDRGKCLPLYGGTMALDYDSIVTDSRQRELLADLNCLQF
jgi:hypothetical protein